MKKINIQIKIEEQTIFGAYHDAIIMDEKDYKKLSEAEVDALVLQRIQEYVAQRQFALDNPPPPLTQQQKQEYLQSLLEQKQRVEQEILEIESQLSPQGNVMEVKVHG